MATQSAPDETIFALQPKAAKGDAPAMPEEQAIMHSSIRHGSSAEVILAIAAVLAICAIAKLVLVTILVSILIAFLLEPIVCGLTKVHIPRPAASAFAVLLLLGSLAVLSHFSYQRAVEFSNELPKYQDKIKEQVGRLQAKLDGFRKTTQQVLPSIPENVPAVTVKLQETSSIPAVGGTVGSMTEAVLTLMFSPFLVYFMLTGYHHARASTIKLFAVEHQAAAYTTFGQIAEMIRSFLTGNVIIGLLLSLASAGVFAYLDIPFFYFVGMLSGFLSLIPYLGVLLAIVPPIVAGMGILSMTGVAIIVVTVLSLHLIGLTVLYPKILGQRLQLNPLVITLALLIWGWIWGATGLILAVPVMAAIKIICDHVDRLRPIGEWMADQ